ARARRRRAHREDRPGPLQARGRAHLDPDRRRLRNFSEALKDLFAAGHRRWRYVSSMSERLDLYAPIHKGLRAAMHATVARPGQMDSDDHTEVGEVLAQLRDLLDYLQHHLEIEEQFVHAALLARRPDAIRAVRADHEEHVKAFALLRGEAEGLE